MCMRERERERDRKKEGRGEEEVFSVYSAKMYEAVFRAKI